ncbi:MAG: hypothetical protein ACYTEE_09975 [Planctomycetota bacterium]|jgi:hypothetical protein
MKRRVFTLVAIAALLAAPVAYGAEETRWINVHVTENSSNTNVEVHLPLNLVLTVLRNVDVENFHGGHVDLELGEDYDINFPEIMAAVKDAPDGKFVTVTSDEADVNVHKQSGTLYVTVNQKEDEMAKVEVTVPLEMMDALTFGEENTLDVTALLQAFDKLPNGELVKVTSNEANVRVWIE